MARAGSVDAALFLLSTTADDDKRRGSALHTMLWDEQLLNHPEVVVVLADGIGAAELALRQPDLLALQELSVQARQEIVAEITDPKTSPARIIRLAPLLPLLDPPPMELGEILAAQIGYAGTSSGASRQYAQAFAALYPGRARELYLRLSESEEYGDGSRAGWLLDGLGAEAEPLLEMLVDRLVGDQVDDKYRKWLAGPDDEGYSQGPMPYREHELSSYSRRRLVLAIGDCGPAAAPYARQLLWALKQACYERTLATVPVSVLSRPPEYLERELDRSHQPHDALIEALSDALVAAGPEALDAVLRVAHGQLNDGATRMGTYGEYRNPGYDRRLRIVALTLLGELGVSDEEAVRLLTSALYAEGALAGWSYHQDDELDGLRRIAAAEALGKLGVASDEVVTALLSTALDGDTEVRSAAVSALRRLAGWEYSLAED